MVEDFCKSILELGTGSNKALANLVMGLASQKRSSSVAQISLSRCYHYQFSSINKAISEIFERKKLSEEEQLTVAKERLKVEKKFVFN